jgi:hypothetical protein
MSEEINHEQAGNVERLRVHSERTTELLKRQLSNSVILDTSLLSYSVAGLGLSLSLLKDLVPLEVAVAVWALWLSWWLFVGTVIFTVLSFLVSQKGIKRQLDLDRRYYVGCEDGAADEKNRYATATDYLNCASGVCFIFAILLTTLFFSCNIERAQQ